MLESSQVDLVDFTKKCYLCRIVKPLAEFGQRGTGFNGRCKECRNKKRRDGYRKKKQLLKQRRYIRTRVIDNVVEIPIHCGNKSSRKTERKTIESIIFDLALDIFSEKVADGKQYKKA